MSFALLLFIIVPHAHPESVLMAMQSILQYHLLINEEMQFDPSKSSPILTLSQ